MSARHSDPLTVVTQDGSTWWKRAVDQDGHGLYALGDSTETCPVLRTIRQLAEFGLKSMPAPVADEPQVWALPWAHVMSDHDLHGFLGDLVSAAAGRWQSGPVVPDREVLAAVERVCAEWRTPGVGQRLDGSEFDGVAVRLASVEALRVVVDHSSWEDPHDSPLAHRYTTGRDLPEAGGTR